MKFKALCVSFNIVLFISLLIVFLLPLFIFDGSAMAEFWMKNWFLGTIFALIVVCVNLVFASYWKTMAYLEKEDWPGLAQYLETEAFSKKRYSYRKMGLLCDALLLLGDGATVARLDDTLKAAKPALRVKLAVRFTSAALVTRDYARIRALSDELAGKKGAETDWLAFHAAFASLLERDYASASRRFISLSESAREPLVVAVSAFVAASVLPGKFPAESGPLAAAGTSARDRILAKYRMKAWSSLTDEAKSDMRVVVLGKIVDETTAWLYAEG